jgi:SAM-dependent methyltransferase
MDQRKHWDRIGAQYGEEIFDVFASDRRKVLPDYLALHGNALHDAMDFGCGTGKALPMLAPLFSCVHGLDISDSLLAQAELRGYKNVLLRQADLTKPLRKSKPVDFVFSCNVIMLPTRAQNLAMLKNIFRVLKPGGTALIIVPSFESVLLASTRLIEWYGREGVSAKKIPKQEFDYYRGAITDTIQGLVQIDGVPTQHYTEPVLSNLLYDAGLRLLTLDKIEYDWNTEFDRPPSWMRAPFPWDWLVECTKP